MNFYTHMYLLSPLTHFGIYPYTALTLDMQYYHVQILFTIIHFQAHNTYRPKYIFGSVFLSIQKL